MQTVKDKPMYRFLVLLTIGSAVGLQAWQMLFNNFAVDVAHLDGSRVGVIQSVREIPGFLSLLAVFVMLFVKEHRIAALSIFCLGLGLALTGWFPSFFGLLATTLVMSFGFHYYETTNQSLALQYFDQTKSPWVFGRLRSLAAGSNIAVGVAVLGITSFLDYRQVYLLIGGCIMAAGLWAFKMDPTDHDVIPQHRHMVFRRKYWLFYFLTFMGGARRQIFMAFAVLLLVKKFNYSVQQVAILFVVNNAINYFLSPAIGRAIMRFGERRVLSLEYGSLIFIFAAYAWVKSPLVAAALYVLDHIFFNFAMAIRTYFQKVADPRDIAPSMAVGFTINHIAAVLLPALGGLVWMVDYRIPFWGGAAMSLVSLAAVQRIRLPKNT